MSFGASVYNSNGSLKANFSEVDAIPGFYSLLISGSGSHYIPGISGWGTAGSTIIGHPSQGEILKWPNGSIYSPSVSVNNDLVSWSGGTGAAMYIAIIHQ